MIIYLLIINAAALLLMYLDKQFARKKARRIPESALMLTGVLGGTVGALIGMYLFRHKTKHLKFTLGLPLILVLQLAAAAAYKFFI